MNTIFITMDDCIFFKDKFVDPNFLLFETSLFCDVKNGF